MMNWSPPMNQCMMSVLSIAANAAKAMMKPDPTRQRWTRPNARQVKINVDGSFHSDVCAGAAGVVARDYEDRFIAARSLYMQNIASATAAEAIAMREGLALANNLGCINIVAESDSTDVIEACTGANSWWGEASATFADCIDLASLIRTVSFRYCPREANEVAHELGPFCLGWLWLAMAGCECCAEKLLSRGSCFSEMKSLANQLAVWL